MKGRVDKTAQRRVCVKGRILNSRLQQTPSLWYAKMKLTKQLTMVGLMGMITEAFHKSLPHYLDNFAM